MNAGQIADGGIRKKVLCKGIEYRGDPGIAPLLGYSSRGSPVTMTGVS